MKYIAILAVIIFIVRIDFFLGVIEKNIMKSDPAPAEVSADEISSNREVISVKEDISLKQSPKQNFLALLEDFRTAPVPEIRNQAMNVLKSNVTMFGQKLDPELEARIFNWTELLSNNEPEVTNFMLDLMPVLQGENLDMLKRFFSKWMEINMEHFIAAYVRTKDSNCSIATVFPTALPEDEMLNEYYERADALGLFLAKEKLDPLQKSLAQNCKLVVTIQLDKLAPKTTPLPLPYLDPTPENNSAQPEPAAAADTPQAPATPAIEATPPTPVTATPATPAPEPTGGMSP